MSGIDAWNMKANYLNNMSCSSTQALCIGCHVQLSNDVGGVLNECEHAARSFFGMTSDAHMNKTVRGATWKHLQITWQTPQELAIRESLLFRQRCNQAGVSQTPLCQRIYMQQTRTGQLQEVTTHRTP
jgi:hypothetical protein